MSVLRSSLPSTQRLVLLALLALAPGNGGVETSRRDLAQLTGLSQSGLLRILRALESVGWLDRIAKKTEDGGNGPNVYRVKVPDAPR
jgi:DNA-binding MarR family transcriptional regulator